MKKNIIFDLGGVIEKISPTKVIEKFKDIGMVDAENFFSLYRQSDTCSKFETGEITPEEFIQHIRNNCTNSATDNEIISAWCSNQIGVEKSTLFVLKELKNRGYNLYILSNTNPIHYNEITSSFYKRYNEKFEALFSHVYLSYELKARKPGRAPYKKLTDKGIYPLSSIYIDDLEENLQSPRELGFTTLLHKTNESIEYLLSRFT